MISLSRLIKFHWVPPVEPKEKKIISVRILEQTGQEDQRVAFGQTEKEKTEILEKARAKAELIISEAASRAEAMNEQAIREQQLWEKEKAALAEQARQEGFEAGLEEGRKQGRGEYRESIAFAREIIEMARNDYKQHLESSEKTLLELGVKIAGRILGEKLEADETSFLSIVKRAIKEARNSREIQLHVNPVHYDFLLSQKAELTALFPKETDFYIYPDEELPEEACCIESETGRIDASIDSQLEELRIKLMEILESEPE